MGDVHPDPEPGSAPATRPAWREAGRRIVPIVVGLAVVGGVVAALAGPSDDGSLRTNEGEGSETSTAGGRDATGSEPTGLPPTTAAAVPPTTAAPATSAPATTAPATTAPATIAPVTTAAAADGARLQVKFVDGSGVRLRDGRLVSMTGQDLTALNSVLVRYPGTAIERLFSRPEEELAAEKAAVEASSGRLQADLNLYYRLTLVRGADANAALADLGRLAVVERAYADPGAAPAPAPPPGP